MAFINAFTKSSNVFVRLSVFSRLSHKEHGKRVVACTARHKTVDISVFDGNAARDLLDLRTECVRLLGAIGVTDKDKIVVARDIVLLEELHHFGNGFLSADRLCDDTDFAFSCEFEHRIDMHDHAKKRGER